MRRLDLQVTPYSAHTAVFPRGCRTRSWPVPCAQAEKVLRGDRHGRPVDGSLLCGAFSRAPAAAQAAPAEPGGPDRAQMDLTEARLAAAATGLLFLFQAAQLTGAGPQSSAGSASCCPQAVFLHKAYVRSFFHATTAELNSWRQRL